MWGEAPSPRAKPSGNVGLLRFGVKQQRLTLLPKRKPKASSEQQILNPASPQVMIFQAPAREEVRLTGASQEEGAAPNPEAAVAPCPSPSQAFPVLSHKSVPSRCAHDVSSASRQRVPRVTDSCDGCHTKCWDSSGRVQAWFWSQKLRQIRVSFRGKAAGSAGRLCIIFLPSPGSVPAVLLV